MLRHLATLLLLATPALAEPKMTGPELEAYATGKTLYFGTDGEAYGGEEYLENRRVRWSFLDGDCKEGYWYEAGEQICFVYEDTLDPHCWSFMRSATGLIARFENNPEYDELYEVEQADEPLLCLGPEVGV